MKEKIKEVIVQDLFTCFLSFFTTFLNFLVYFYGWILESAMKYFNFVILELLFCLDIIFMFRVFFLHCLLYLSLCDLSSSNLVEAAT